MPMPHGHCHCHAAAGVGPLQPGLTITLTLTLTLTYPKVSALSNLVNVCMDPFLMFTMGMGIAGAGT